MLKINKKIRKCYLFKKCTFSFDLNKRKDFDWRISSGSSLKQKGPWNQKDFLAASVFTRGNIYIYFYKKFKTSASGPWPL